MRLVTDDEITTKLEALPDWHRADPDEPSITATYQFDYFSTALAFVNGVGGDVEQMNHHPDVHILWNTVILVLSTRSEGGSTQGDFEIARRISKRHDRWKALR